MTAEERSENNARHRRNSQSLPARYVNGVRLSDDEVANITKHKVKEKIKNEARAPHTACRKVANTNK